MGMFGAIGAGAEMLTGLLGAFFSQADEDTQNRLLMEASDSYGNVNPGYLQQLVAQEVEKSSLEGAPSDYGNKGSRNAAIHALMNEGLSGGNSLEAQLAQANAQRAAGQASRQAQQSALANAAQRGQGGSAATLQAQLLGGSQGADRAAQMGLQGAYNSRMQALQALQQGGMMAGQAEQADTSADQRRREAMDRIAMFNAQQRAAANQQNRQIQQQNWQNQLTASERRAGGKTMAADVYGKKARRTREIWGGVGEGLNKAGQALDGGGGGGGGGGGQDLMSMFGGFF